MNSQSTCQTSGKFVAMAITTFPLCCFQETLANSQTKISPPIQVFCLQHWKNPNTLGFWMWGSWFLGFRVLKQWSTSTGEKWKKWKAKYFYFKFPILWGKLKFLNLSLFNLWSHVSLRDIEIHTASLLLWTHMCWTHGCYGVNTQDMLQMPGSEHILSWKRLTGLKVMENWCCADSWLNVKEKTKKISEVSTLIL